MIGNNSNMNNPFFNDKHTVNLRLICWKIHYYYCIWGTDRTVDRPWKDQNLNIYLYKVCPAQHCTDVLKRERIGVGSGEWGTTSVVFGVPPQFPLSSPWVAGRELQDEWEGELVTQSVSSVVLWRSAWLHTAFTSLNTADTQAGHTQQAVWGPIVITSYYRYQTDSQRGPQWAEQKMVRRKIRRFWSQQCFSIDGG